MIVISLATRLSGFFLASLALVLGAFSITLFLLARTHFLRDFDERLVTTLDVLSAAADVEGEKVEWEPAARPLVLAAPTQEDPVRWVVSDGQGHVLEQSWTDLDKGDLRLVLSWSPEFGHVHAPFVDRGGRHWRLAVRRIRAGSPSFIAPDRHEHGDQAERAHGEPAPVVPIDARASLILAAGAPSEPMEADLSRVGWTLAGLSVVIWLIAALVGRRLSNRALLPVTRMAKAACAMGAGDRQQRLPSPATGDELDALANSFNGLLDRLQHEFERQKEFTGNASHQLRTPLTAMLGQLEVALRRDRPAAEYRRVLDDVRGEAVKLRQIVESLLFMARAETEAGQPDLQPVELVGWVGEHLREWSGHPRANDFRLVVELESPAWVYAHPPLLGQLVDNLLDNACKYSTSGTAITVRLTRELSAVVLVVEDMGFGLADDETPHVFEPFFRSADARKRGDVGVGLGLAVVERIARLFGGTISADSLFGRGSRFALRLPELAKPQEGGKAGLAAAAMGSVSGKRDPCYESDR
jgi:signal transduction histidine kinase